jgi:hypothetical protein
VYCDDVCLVLFAEFLFLFSVISVPEGDFFFDFVRHLMEWLKKTRATSASMIPQ